MVSRKRSRVSENELSVKIKAVEDVVGYPTCRLLVSTIEDGERIRNKQSPLQLCDSSLLQVKFHSEIEAAYVAHNEAFLTLLIDEQLNEEGQSADDRDQVVSGEAHVQMEVEVGSHSQ